MSACCGEQVVLAQQLIEPLHIFEGRLRRGNRVGIKTFACRKRFSTLKRGEAEFQMPWILRFCRSALRRELQDRYGTRPYAVSSC